MYDPNIEQIKDPIAKDVYVAILTNKTIKKHTINYTFFSGCSTEVYPIDLCLNDVEVYVDTNKGHLFEKAIQKVVTDNPQLFKDGYFCKSDGSCHSFIRLKYSDALLKRIDDYCKKKSKV